MKYMIVMFVCLFVLLCIYAYCRKKKICEKVRSMTAEEKCSRLQNLIAPFGYCYMPSGDFFSTGINTPQRAFGYTALYDQYAAEFHMVIDAQPVYFDYGNETWLIEFWKGQYGICVGAEVGIYHAGRLVPAAQRKTALFQSVEDARLFPLSMRLFQDNQEIARLRRRHWWLTAFLLGEYCEPGDLSVEFDITFPNEEMRSSFVRCLAEQTTLAYRVRDLQVRILFRRNDGKQVHFPEKLVRRFVQWQNRLLCRLFAWITKPFCSSVDRLMYLCFYCPAVFRLFVKDRKHIRCAAKSCRRCRL